MLAALGFPVAEFFHPLFGWQIDLPSYIAFQETPLQKFWGAVVLAIAVPEIFSVFTFRTPFINGGETWSIRKDHEPGDFDFDPLSIKPTNPAELKEMQDTELINGRVAMIGIAGMVAQELVSGQKLFMLSVSGTEEKTLEMKGAVAPVQDPSSSATGAVAPVRPPAKIDPLTFAKTLPGIIEQVGFFDPLGFCSKEGTTEGKIRFYREVELKHGRVAMLAALGFPVAEFFHPLFGWQIDLPSYIAFQETPLQKFWGAVVLAIAVPEIFSVFTFRTPFINGGETWSIRKDHEPGDFDFDPLSIKPTNPAELKEMQDTELINGRVAMIGIAGMVAQELVSGQKLFMLSVSGTEEMTRPPVTPRAEVTMQVEPRFDGMAYAKTLPGISAPFGFFDPLGFCSKDDITEGKVRFYREVELKHGRVAMLAAFGFLFAESFHPFFPKNDVPSYIAFQQTPLQNGGPGVGAAMGLFIAAIEIFSVFTFRSPFGPGGEKWAIRVDYELGDFGFDPLGLKPTDPAELKEMQTKEINNGRLAMIAIIGMIGQELANGHKLFG